MPDFSELEKTIGIEFFNKNFLKEALTHSSYLNENHFWSLPSNERLEFLGDAVLELAVTEELFIRYPQFNEGKLTAIRSALVNHLILAEVAKKFSLQKYLLLSKGEAKESGKSKDIILANAFEALLGAIYLDKGFKKAKEFINHWLMPHLDKIVKYQLYKDPKSLLQEVVQAKLKITPSYSLLEEKGPDHKKIFKVGVFFNEKLIAQGEGTSKQEAEIEAAKKALEKIKAIKTNF